MKAGRTLSTHAGDADASSDRPRVLYLTHRVPHPPNRGDRIRSYHTLRFLAERADVDLACLSDEPVSAQSHEVLEGLCHRIAIEPLGRASRWARAFASLARGRSASERLFYSPKLFKTVEQWSHSTSYDAVLAFCSSMAPYLDAGRLPQSPTFVDLVDVDSQKWFDYAGRARLPLRWLFQTEGQRVRRLEQALAARSKAMFVVSEDEANLFRKFCPARNIQAIGNGVDLEYFQPAAACQESTTPECVFIGALDYRANIDGITWFCQEVWPQVIAAHPTARLRLVGRRPPSCVQQLAELPGVEIAADVPDVRPYLHTAHVVIAPLRIARGIQNKVLEALAAGKAVVASKAALDGLAVSPSSEVSQADTPAEWCAAISTLFNDQSRREEMGTAGRRFAIKHHQWSSCLLPLAESLGLAQPCTNKSASETGHVSHHQDNRRLATNNA